MLDLKMNEESNIFNQSAAFAYKFLSVAVATLMTDGNTYNFKTITLRYHKRMGRI